PRIGTATGSRTRPSGMRLQRRLQLTLAAGAESEGVEPSSVTSPSLFSRQVAGLPAALSLAEGERIERPRAQRRARLPVSNGTPCLSSNLPRRAAGRRG